MTKAEWARTVRSKRIAQGKCVHCGRDPIAEGSKQFCTGCRDRKRRIDREYQQRRRDIKAGAIPVVLNPLSGSVERA